MITKYGMSEKLGPIAFGSDNDEVFLGKTYNHTRNYSENIAAAIDEEVEAIINNAYKRTETILTEHIDQLHAVSEVLVRLEKIDREQFESLMSTGKLPEENVEETVENTEEITETTENTDNV
jgi:cell division protease FtsH